MIDAFCATCQRTTYVQSDAAMHCPVCSSPLVQVERAVPEPEMESETA